MDRRELIESHAQTAETAMDLLSALEAVQAECVRRNDWSKLRLKPHELAVLRQTYHRLAALRCWLVEAVEEEEACVSTRRVPA